MSREQVFNPQPWGNGFIANQPELVTAKVDRMRAAGADRIGIAVDFDETVIKGSSWHLFYGMMSGRRQRRHARDASINVPKLGNHDLTYEEAAVWQRASIRRLYGMRLSRIQRIFSEAPITPGVQAFMHIAEEAGIPTVIRSAGIADAIGAVVAANNIKAAIVATRLRKLFGFVVGFDPKTFTHDLDKTMATTPEVEALMSGRDQHICIGDRMGDTNMQDGPEVLRIRTDGKLPPGPLTDEYLHESFITDGELYTYPYDLVVVDSDFHAPAELLEEIVLDDPCHVPSWHQ